VTPKQADIRLTDDKPQTGFGLRGQGMNLGPATDKARVDFAYPKRNAHPHELFIIEPGLWKAAQNEEIEATCKILRQMNLYELPYPTVTVRLDGREIMYFDRHKQSGLADTIANGEVDDDGRPTSECLFMDITVTTEPGSGCRLTAYNSQSGFCMEIVDRDPHDGSKPLVLQHVRTRNERQGKLRMFNAPEYRERMRKAVCDFLIALLATKNIVKVRQADKLAKLGIGRNSKRGYKHRYTYTTTLRVPRPEDMEDDKDHPPTWRHVAPHLRRAHLRNQHYGPGNKFTKQILIPSVFVNADADYVSQREAYNVGLGRSAVLDSPQTEEQDNGS